MLSVIVPVYNEENAVVEFHGKLLAAMDGCGIDYTILYVNDGSTDRTGELLKGLDKAGVVHLDRNIGYGGAIKIGIRQSSSEHIAIIDCDGTYDPAEIPRLYGHMERCEMVVGQQPSRTSISNFSKLILRKMASYAVAYPIPDLNSGLRIFTRELALKHMRLLPNGFSLTSTITMAALYDPSRVRFVPISYSPRVGKSKIRPLRAFMQFSMLIARTMVLFNPLKFFIPLSLASGAIGIAFFIRDLVAWDLASASILMLTNSCILLAIGLLAEAIRCKE
jgi:glycosyltransferase involved in cell wall biosynthesis